MIPARDAAATLPAAVTSALGQDWPGLDVVVAVGPSRDDTAAAAAELAAADPRVTVVDNPAGTTPAALNAAAAAAAGEVIVRLDAHAELPPGYVRRAVATLRETGAVNVGGRQVPVADRGFAAGVAAAMRSPVGAGGAAYRGSPRPGPVDTVYLGVFRRDALQAVGGFDPRLVRNQDYELNVRLRQAGGTVWYDPELAVDYRPRDRVGALSRQYLEYGRWKRATLRLHPSSLRARQLAPPALVVGLDAAALLSLLLTALWPVSVALGAYLLVVAAGVVTSPARPRHWPVTALALVVMHTSWGLGFLVGPPAGALDPHAGPADPSSRQPPRRQP